MRNIVIAVIFVLGAFGISATLENDTKIGYVYMDLVLQNMEETQKMNKLLNEMSKELASELKTSTADLNDKVIELQEQKNKGALQGDKLKEANASLEKMKEQLETHARKNEQVLQDKRNSMLGPITKKLEEAMDQVAAKAGYKYVLNSSDGTGKSLVLVAPEADDLTDEVMQYLEIKK